jgi:hypothetical protein
MKNILEFIIYKLPLESECRDIITLDFSSSEFRYIFKDNVIQELNNFYLPFSKNFDRFDD